jgi:hypothetical protein
MNIEVHDTEDGLIAITFLLDPQIAIKLGNQLITRAEIIKANQSDYIKNEEEALLLT